MKKKSFVSSISILTILLISSFNMTVLANPLEDQVNVNVISPSSVDFGDDFNVTVNITNVEDFDATNFDVLFDSNIINVTGVSGGKINNTDVPLSGWNLIEDGKLRVILNIPGVTGASGDGYLVKIQFETISPGTSSINLSNGILSNIMAEEIIAEWNNNSVKVIDTLIPTIKIKISYINLFYAKIQFENTGSVNVSSLDWNLSLKTLLTNNINFSDNGTLKNLDIDEEKTIRTDDFGAGLGFVILKINAKINEHKFNEEFFGIKIGPIMIFFEMFNANF